MGISGWDGLCPVLLCRVDVGQVPRGLVAPEVADPLEL